MSLSNSNSVIAGQFRNVAILLVAALSSFCYLSSGLQAAIIPTLSLVALIVHAIMIKAGWKKITTLLRKLLSSGVGLLAILGFLDPAQHNALNALFVAILPLSWSWAEKSLAPKQAPNLILVGFWLCLGVGSSILFSSCVSFDASYVDPKTGAKAGINYKPKEGGEVFIKGENWEVSAQK